MWNPFRSKLAAAILGGVEAIHIKPGAKVLYLGAASGTTVSHVSDLVGPVSFSIKDALLRLPLTPLLWGRFVPLIAIDAVENVLQTWDSCLPLCFLFLR